MKDTSKSKRLVVICPPLKNTVVKVRKLLKKNGFRWAYLGEDVSRAIAIEEQLGDRGQRIEIADELQKIADSLRQPYLDYIGKLSLENNSILWWVGSLSEKNPWVSKTFLYACYVRLFKALLDSSGQEALVFFGENRALRECLVKNIADCDKYEIHRLEPLSDAMLEPLRHALGMVVYKGYFVARSIYRRSLARYYRLNQFPQGKPPEKEETVLLQNWVDQRSFDASGHYRDSYFGGLAQHLKSKGKRVVVVPHILPTVSYRQTLKKMVSGSEVFLVPEASLSISDIFRVLVRAMRNPPARKLYPALAGIDVSEIIQDEFSRDRRGISMASSLLLYEVVRSWKKAGIPIDTFIYAYENQIWEKAYCMALREFYPSAKIIGYQHATVPKMLLNYFFSRAELPVLPSPDRVITTGRYTEKLFKESGYDPEKVVCGGAIRYASLKDRGKEARVKKKASHPVILVTPSIDRNETVEMGWKVFKAFGQMGQYKVVLKFHPDCPYQRIAGDLGPLPKHFVVSDRPVGELLRESSLLLYSSSATCIEALALGVPVLHIKSDFIIDRDNLSDFPAIRQSAKNKQDIITMTQKILDTGERELSKQRAVWADVVSEILGQVDESVFDLFS